MTIKREGGHLRLVRTTQNNDRLSFHFAEQLALPYIDPYTLVLINVDTFDVHTFTHLLQALHPKWIVDARTAPRLDTIAGTRSFAFRLFEEFNTTYLDLFGFLRLGTYKTSDANPAFWGKKLGEILKNSHSPAGPYVMLFDNHELMGASAKFLGEEIKSGLEKNISVSLMNVS